MIHRIIKKFWFTFSILCALISLNVLITDRLARLQSEKQDNIRVLYQDIRDRNKKIATLERGIQETKDKLQASQEEVGRLTQAEQERSDKIQALRKDKQEGQGKTITDKTVQKVSLRKLDISYAQPFSRQYRFALFRNGGRGQGIGNIMNGLLAVHLLAIKYNRICCVSDWSQFSLAFVSNNDHVCKLIVGEKSEHQISLWNFGPNMIDRNCWLAQARCDNLLRSEEKIIEFTGNDYPFEIFPALGRELFDKLYRPSALLLSYFPDSYKIPETVLHLRVGDDFSDRRSGLNIRTQMFFIHTFPNTSFIISNNQIINDRFKAAGWRAYKSSPGQMHTVSLNNKDLIMKAWRDWYTIFQASSVYHTPSAFSESAIRASGTSSRRIIKDFDATTEKDLQSLTEAETWSENQTPT